MIMTSSSIGVTARLARSICSYQHTRYSKGKNTPLIKIPLLTMNIGALQLDYLSYQLLGKRNYVRVQKKKRKKVDWYFTNESGF